LYSNIKPTSKQSKTIQNNPKQSKTIQNNPQQSKTIHNNPKQSKTIQNTGSMQHRIIPSISVHCRGIYNVTPPHARTARHGHYLWQVPLHVARAQGPGTMGGGLSQITVFGVELGQQQTNVFGGQRRRRVAAPRPQRQAHFPQPVQRHLQFLSGRPSLLASSLLASSLLASSLLAVSFVLPHDRGKQLHGGGKAAVGPAQSTDTFGHARHRVFAHAGGGGGGHNELNQGPRFRFLGHGRELLQKRTNAGGRRLFSRGV
jgi:hypothetical protein